MGAEAPGFFEEPSGEDIVTRWGTSGTRTADGPSRGGDIVNSPDASAKPVAGTRSDGFGEDQLSSHGDNDQDITTRHTNGPNTISRPYRPPANTTTTKPGQYGTTDAARAARAELDLKTFKGY